MNSNQTVKFYNSLTHKIEDFKSIEEKKVRLYTCGPTVYDSAHIGNLRAYVFGDTLKRVLILNGYQVNHVMNITNVDDKTIHGANGIKTDFEILVKKFEAKFWQDSKEINNLPPDIITRPTEYIEKIVKFIEKLIEKGYAYKTEDGSVYYSISKFKNYGLLSHLDMAGLKVGARVNQDEYDKENPADFALWKAWAEDDGEVSWQTPFGKGHPGWHIECSVMATDVLGDTIDIHTGGVDLMFPHHENEIAQSEACTGKKFVNFWLHNEFLLVDNLKMSKSLKNFYTLDDIKAKGYSGLDFRYLCLQAHYRSKMNFTWEGLVGAKNTRERLMRVMGEFKAYESGKINERYLNEFYKYINNDLDLPGALAVFWQMLRDEDVSNKDKYVTALEFDKIFGLLLDQETILDIPQKITDLVSARQKAKEVKDYALADKIRTEIEGNGYLVEDTAGGAKVVKR